MNAEQPGTEGRNARIPRYGRLCPAARRRAPDVVAVGAAWKAAPAPMRFATWLLDPILAAGAFELAPSAGVAPPLHLRTLLTFTRAWL